jgi:hypothetical protein
VPADRSWGTDRRRQVLNERPKKSQQLFAGREVLPQSHPEAGPTARIAAAGRNIGGRHRRCGAVILEGFGLSILRAMDLTTILNHGYLLLALLVFAFLGVVGIIRVA